MSPGNDAGAHPRAGQHRGGECRTVPGFARAVSRVPSHRLGSVAGVGRPRVYQEERVVRAVRLPASTDAELRALATSRNCSINQLVAEAVEGLVGGPGPAPVPPSPPSSEAT